MMVTHCTFSRHVTHLLYYGSVAQINVEVIEQDRILKLPQLSVLM